jgi:lipoprotein-releasing system permease protein
MKAGKIEDLKPGEFGIALGVGLARALRLNVGDRVTLISPQGQVTPAGLMPRLKQFTVVGIFQMDHNEFDTALALINMQDAQVLYRMDSAVSGIRLKVKDLDRAPQVTRELAKLVTNEVYLSDWTQQNVNYFRAIQIEKRMMFIILTLIIAVAAFNLVSTLVMTVTDKQADIAILRTLGASPLSVMGIFVVQGALSGIIGTLSGVALGLLVAFNVGTLVAGLEALLHMSFLPASVYLISHMPSDPQQGDIVPVVLISLLLSFIATLYPSWRASRVQPAEALRYE